MHLGKSRLSQLQTNTSFSAPRYKHTLYTNAATFTTQQTTYILHTIENALFHTLDPTLTKKLTTWLSQFDKYSTNILPIPGKTPQRFIQPYSHLKLPKSSPTLSRPFMKFLEPKHPKNLTDPTLHILGFHNQYPNLTKPELKKTKTLLASLYRHTCQKYTAFQRKLTAANKKQKTSFHNLTFPR